VKITFYTPKILPRLRYIVQFMLEEQLQLTVHWTEDAAFFAQADTPKINYSSRRLTPEEFFVPQHPFLTETTIQSQHLSLFQENGLPAFFAQKTPEADLSFDLFALSFYLLSRYEEYLPFPPDAHGRFPASESLAQRAGFLHQPLIDQWVLELKKLLLQKFPSLQFPNRQACFLPTYDVDQAWAYRHKAWWRTLGGLANALRRQDWYRLRERFRVLFLGHSDPFFTFPYLDRLHERFGVAPIYFFLLGNHGPFDKNISPKKQAFRQLIQRLNQRYDLGIHPSYQSNTTPTLVQTEIRRLQQITQEPVTKSRQHFLQLRFPQTYRQLLAAGIKEDYTMGYADAVGFRASTAHPFFWYDLENETTTSLRIFPFQSMDVTLKQYLGLSPKAGLETLQQLWQATQQVHGTFITLWHNSSFAEAEGWSEWQQVYEKFLAEVVDRQ